MNLTRKHFIMLFLFSFLVVRVNAQTKSATTEAGKVIYEVNCLACHQADGGGVPQMAPLLSKLAMLEVTRLN